MKIHFFWCREAPKGHENDQKKWNTVGKTWFCGLRVRPNPPKEMENH
jgi:hypothetical protein